MIDRRTAVMIALVGVSLLFAAVAASAAGSFGDGEYALDLPGVGDFEFVIDSEDGEVVQSVDAPAGYELEGDAADVLSWTSERPAPASVPKVEIKPDKIKAEVYWAKGPVRLSMPGGWIKVTEPDFNGAFTVETGGSWWPFGRGANWYVADDENIHLARSFFKVGANSRSVEIAAVKSVDPGFVNSLDEDQNRGKGSENRADPKDGGAGKSESNNSDRRNDKGTG
jgi:hypothetical protein